MEVLTAKYILGDDFLTCILSGEIDHHTAKTVREEIDAQIIVNRKKTFKLDLSKVSFMDSSGLGLIMGRYRRTKEYGAELIILNPSKTIEKMLELAGTDKIIPIEKTEEERK